MRMTYISPDADAAPIDAHGTSLRSSQFLDALTDHGVAVERFTTGSNNKRNGVEPDTAAHDQLLLEHMQEHCSGIDLVYQCYAPWSHAGSRFAKSAWVPFFLEVDNPAVLNPSSRSSAMEDPVIAAADLIIVASPALREHALVGGIPRHKIRVLDYAVSAAALATRKRQRRLPCDLFVIGYLGSLETRKGTEILLEAFADLRGRDQRYRLLIVGGGPMQPEVENFCKRLGVEEYVEMAGRIHHQDVPAYLGRMDAGIAPYPENACCDAVATKVWEYAAARVPIIASAGHTSELRELFPHKEAAMLTRPGDAGDIADRAVRLCNDIDLARSISRAARLKAKRCTWSRIAAQIESLHKKFLASQLYG